MLEKSFGLFFFLKQPKIQKNDERYVYVRITVDGISKELSLKRVWYVDRWNQPVGRASGTKEDAKILNSYLDAIGAKIYQAKIALLEANKTVSAEALKNVVTGIGEEKRMLLEIFGKQIEEIKSLVGTDYSYKTLQKRNTTYSHTKAFINWKYNLSDFEITELNYEFVKDFSVWLKTVKKCNHNSTMKYITTLKSVIIECIKKKWLKADPFSEFSTAQKKVVVTPLYNDELLAIENKKITIDRLNLVKNIFVFSCYTGLAYVDVCNLKRSQIVNYMDGEQWIITTRQKTDASQRIPLLPQAIAILDKYKEHPKCANEDFALPILSNQKMNAYLKEIADICGIKKKLTFHIARHTFATTVTLANGVPIETVSSILGHSTIAQTQHYAKIVALKLGQDMGNLRRKLSGS